MNTTVSTSSTRAPLTPTILSASLACWEWPGSSLRPLVSRSHPCRLKLCRPQGNVLRNQGVVALPCEPVVVIPVGGVDADAVSIRRQARSVHRHVIRPLRPLHHDRVAKLYAVELRVGDGVREKSGRGGVARSRPIGRRPASEDGEAHAWLGPAALLGPASPDLTVVPSSSPADHAWEPWRRERRAGRRRAIRRATTTADAERGGVGTSIHEYLSYS